MSRRVRQGVVLLGFSVVPASLAGAQPGPPSEPRGAPAFESYVRSIPGTKVSFEMAAIRAGSVSLGSTSGEAGRAEDEGPAVRVAVGSFWMGRHEVTWNEFDLFAQGLSRAPEPSTPAGVDPNSRPTPPYADESFGYGKGRQPVLSVSHHAAMEYCRWLSLRTGQAYRLPTEAEWEYACRVGSTSRFGFGDDERALADHAWHRANAEDRPHPVGGRKANAWGLFDMHGNVAEWVLDRYERDSYARWAGRPGVVGPVLLPNESRYPHVIRGGSWDDGAAALRCAARRASDAAWNRRDPQRPQSIWWLTDATHVGFRVVRALFEQPELVGLRSRVTRESPRTRKEEAMGEERIETATRREFLRTGAAVVGGTLSAPVLPGAWAAGSDEIKVGLVGCGGRGRGAVKDALNAADGVRLVALGDAFPDRIAEARASFKDLGERAQVPAERCFAGLDACRQVLAADVNYVILATPPAFRPEYLKAAVAAGKHVFAEKPVAVDGPGIRSVLAVHEEAKAKGLGIGVGTQRRHQNGYLETMKRIKDGAIGEIVAARCYWNQGGLWNKPRKAEWSDLEWQIRNWLYFTWLSGDHIVEQHVHNLDVINWAVGGHPVRALGMGGRQVRTDPAYGHIFDHFSIDYEYENGMHLLSMCRQIDGCDKQIMEALTGTKGTAEFADAAKRWHLTGAKAWKYEGEVNAAYRQEHTDLIASIRAGRPLHELKDVAESTLTAIMGRMSAYTGKLVTWDEALASTDSLVPEKLEWGPMPVAAVAMPGV